MEVLQRARKFPSATGLCDIRYRMWIPKDVSGAVMIVHGMAEHIDRYDDFARYLADRGYLVFGMDNASHGKSLAEGQPKGFFGTKGGWDALIADMNTLYTTVKRDYPQLGFVLFGHSMGSFLARSYAARHSEDFDGYVFSGTAGKNPIAPIGKLLCHLEIKKGKGFEPSALLNAMSAGAYNKKFKNPRTDFDWLTRDEAVVDAYAQDSMCGFAFTPYGMKDLLDGLIEIGRGKWARQVANKPILLMSGAMDPVGGFSKGVLQVEKRLKKTGHTVCCKLYPEGRHEMLNELNREQVYGDVHLFLESVMVQGELQ